MAWLTRHKLSDSLFLLLQCVPSASLDPASMVFVQFLELEAQGNCLGTLYVLDLYLVYFHLHHTFIIPSVRLLYFSFGSRFNCHFFKDVCPDNLTWLFISPLYTQVVLGTTNNLPQLKFYFSMSFLLMHFTPTRV